jgi:hypothetical protein
MCRNGHRARPWETQAGELELAIAKLRRSSYFPSFLEPRKRPEQALVSMSRRRPSPASDAQSRPGGRAARAADLKERGLAHLCRAGRVS